MTNVRVPPPEVPFRDFEKNPGKTLRDVDDEPVKVARDSGQSSLLVTTVDRLDRNVELLDLLVALLEAQIKHPGESSFGGAVAALQRLVPWSSSLPADSQNLMTKEIMGTADCESSEERVNRLDQVLGDWEDTAEALADTEFVAALRGPIANYGRVPCS